MLNRFLFFVLLILLVTVGCDYSYVPSEPTTDNVEATEQILPSGTPIEGQYIIVMNKKDVALGKSTLEMTSLAKNLLTDNGLSPDLTDRIYTHAIAGFTAALSENAAAKLRLDPRVAIVEQDRIISLGRPPGKGGGKNDPEPQQTPWGITRVGGFADGSGTTAWIIDTGIDLKHKDLNVDVAQSANFVPRGKDSPKDGHGHGTHVAGTIGAIDNTIDVVGVAAGANLVAVRVLDNAGSGAYSWVIAGVDYVATYAEPGDAANMSLGGPPSDALDLAILNAAGRGINFSLAAGNSDADANNYSPARVNHTNVYTISAIDINDVFAYFSNWGNPPVDYAAPGVSVLSTKKGGGTTTFSGTSMSAPHVAGILLLGGVKSDGNAL
ncbi:MAG: S8 family serine peptidase, partial [Candidatus Marinimicrobia bacterium]|nr:S8 family serine peptidase [Candidatus Neomarinimicrobiota bacterium]